MTDSQDFRWPFLYRAVFAAVALLVGAFYLWSVQAANPPFEWHYDKSGYYDLLARGFAAGHLYLPLDPPPQMLALRDPLNLQKSGEWALQDAALYRNHYYLYHGVTPALLAFLPWRLLFHHDLPESFAAFIFCLVGFLFSGATLLTMLSWARYRPPLWLWGLALLALGVSQPAPFLLQRVFVYEIAIASGYAFLSAGLWFLARGLSSAKRSPLMMAVSGLCFGLSVGCRPHLAIFGLCAALAVLWCGTGDFGFREMLRSRGLLGYCVAFGACLLAVLWYNYARFDDPLEFGLRYQIADPSYANPKPSVDYLAPGLYYLFTASPEVVPQFPFVRLVTRDFPAIPARYYREPIAGVLTAYPLLILLPFAIWKLPDRRLSSFVRAIAAASLCSALAIASLGIISHRYETDFAPYLLLLVCFSVCAFQRSIYRFTASAALASGICFGLALGITGPNDEFIQKQPARYVKIACWFRPSGPHQLLYNPQFSVDAEFSFPSSWSGRVPLFASGRVGSRFLLSAESVAPGRIRLVSETVLTSGPLGTAEVAFLPNQPNRLHAEYHPDTGLLTVQWNGEKALRHKLPFLVTSPSQVSVGFERTAFAPRTETFPGTVMKRSVRMNGTEWP